MQTNVYHTYSDSEDTLIVTTVFFDDRGQFMSTDSELFEGFADIYGDWRASRDTNAADAPVYLEDAGDHELVCALRWAKNHRSEALQKAKRAARQPH